MSKTAGAEDRPEPDAPGDDDAVRHRMIGARVDLGAGIGEAAAVRGDFGAEPPAEAEPAGRVEQAVAAVIAEAHRKRGDEEGPRVLDARGLNTPRSSVASNSAP